MTRFALALISAAITVGGCASSFDERIDEAYWESPLWNGFATWGETPGHGDSYRIIYYNMETATFSGDAFAPGATIVKEVYDNDGERPGKLRVIEIMRRSINIANAPNLYDVRMGWVFSATSTRGGEEEENSDFCWRRCHANAPFAGAWFDYGVLPAPPGM